MLTIGQSVPVCSVCGLSLGHGFFVSAWERPFWHRHGSAVRCRGRTLPLTPPHAGRTGLCAECRVGAVLNQQDVKKTLPAIAGGDPCHRRPPPLDDACPPRDITGTVRAARQHLRRPARNDPRGRAVGAGDPGPRGAATRPVRLRGRARDDARTARGARVSLPPSSRCGIFGGPAPCPQHPVRRRQPLPPLQRTGSTRSAPSVPPLRPPHLRTMSERRESGDVR
jgi:hypothetical protein